MTHNCNSPSEQISKPSLMPSGIHETKLREKTVWSESVRDLSNLFALSPVRSGSMCQIPIFCSQIPSPEN